MEMNVITEMGFEKIRKKISGISSGVVVYSSEDDDLNRRVSEKLKIDMLLISQGKRKDFMKQRNSGLNHVLAKIAKKNNIEIGINFDEIVSSNGFRLAEILARIRQNIVLCNKAKVKMKFVVLEKKNERNIYDLKSLGLVLGMPTWMIKGF